MYIIIIMYSMSILLCVMLYTQYNMTIFHLYERGGGGGWGVVVGGVPRCSDN